MGNKINNYGITLIVFLVLRGYAQFSASLPFIPQPVSLVYIIVGIAYFAGVSGIVQQKRWTLNLVTAIAVTDILMTLAFTTGAFLVGAVIVDLLLIWLVQKNEIGLPNKINPNNKNDD